MCKYCDMKALDLAEKPIMNDHDVELGIIKGIRISSVIQDNNILSTTLMNEYSDVLSEYNVTIKYCPMCGRKLGE